MQGYLDRGEEVAGELLHGNKHQNKTKRINYKETWRERNQEETPEHEELLRLIMILYYIYLWTIDCWS
jgi:hypothetical protein